MSSFSPPNVPFFHQEIYFWGTSFSHFESKSTGNKFSAFLYLRMCLFPSISERYFHHLWGSGLTVYFFLSVLEKCCITFFWPPWFLMRNLMECQMTWIIRSFVVVSQVAYALFIFSSNFSLNKIVPFIAPPSSFLIASSVLSTLLPCPSIELLIN